MGIASPIPHTIPGGNFPSQEVNEEVRGAEPVELQQFIILTGRRLRGKISTDDLVEQIRGAFPDLSDWLSDHKDKAETVLSPLYILATLWAWLGDSPAILNVEEINIIKQETQVVRVEVEQGPELLQDTSEAHPDSARVSDSDNRED